MLTQRKETLVVTLLFFCLLLVFFWKPIFCGYKLLPADIIYTDPLYFGYAPSDFKRPHNPLLYDQIYQFYPWRVYANHACHQGFLPFWNPYIYSGAPFIAADQPAVFYPLNILACVFSTADSFLFLAFIRLFIAGVTCYAFVRIIGGSKFGSLLSALSFTFSGLVIVWLGHPHANVVIWLPALFLTVEWLYRESSLRHLVYVAFVVALQLTGGHAVLCLYTFTAAGLYYFFRAVSMWWADRQLKSLMKRLLFLAFAVTLGFALTAIHWLPFIEWIQQSAELQLRSSVKSSRMLWIKPQYWVAGMLLAILPNFFSNPTWSGVQQSFLPVWNFVEQTLYVGIVPLALAISAMRQREKTIVFFSVLGVAALGIALQWPILNLVNYLPLFSLAAPGRFRSIYAFCTCILAGLGASSLSELSKRSATAKVLCYLLAGFLFLSILPLLLVGWIIRYKDSFPIWLPFGQVSQDLLHWAFRFSNIDIYWPVLVSLAGILVLTLYRKSHLFGYRTMQIALLILVVADLFAFGMDYHTVVPPQWIFPETAALQLIKNDKGLFRVIGTDTHLMPNTCMVHGLYDVRGLDFPGYRYLELCQAMGAYRHLGYGILFSEQLPARLLNLLNVKYVLTSSSFDATALPDLRLIGADKNVHIYQNMGCLPRAFVVHRVHVAGSAQEALMVLQSSNFDPAVEIVLESPPPSNFFTSPTSPAQSVVEIKRYDPNHVTILAETSMDGLLFLSDSYYPGWKVYVDGIEREIYRADYAFRAVYLTPGQHTVDFVYAPRSFSIGAWISLVSLLITLGLLLGPRLWKLNTVAQ